MALSLITFVAGTKILSASVNSNFSAINAELFDLSNENIANAAGIVDTKLAQISSINKVDGAALVAESIDAVKGQFSWYISGDQVVADDISAIFEASATLSYVSTALYAKTAPTGADLIVDIELKRGAGAWTTLYTVLPTIVAGSNTGGGSAAFDTGTHGTEDQFLDGDLLRVNVDQIGSTLPGSDLTIALKLKQKVPQ